MISNRDEGGVVELEVLVSTMFQENYDLTDKMNIQTNAVIINQCCSEDEIEFYRNQARIKWINTSSRGLSKSRNIALEESNADICLIADDDLVYVSDYEKKIKKEFERFPDADIITFQVEGIEGKYKDYPLRAKKLNYLTLMKVSSVEVAFRRKSILKNGIRYNEIFGAGAKYQMGEENIFLTECLKKGLKIMYAPVKIADLHLGDSSWFTGYSQEYFRSKGAQFVAMSRFVSLLYILQFSLRKHNLYKKEISFSYALKYMIQGRKNYLGHM